jgi:Rad3-related DNA helicase
MIEEYIPLEYQGTELKEPEKQKDYNFTQAEIVEAIKACITYSDKVRANNMMINSLFHILKGLFINDYQFICIEAPTGSGKTIIGFMLNLCVNYLINIHNKRDDKFYPNDNITYYLTSSKMLQEQIDNDIPKFNLDEYVSILKGVVNYPCIYANNEYIKLNTLRMGISEQEFKKSSDYKMISYAERQCKGMKMNECAESFPNCFDICPYRCARSEASEKTCAVLNYAYFLTIRQGFNPFFGDRLLTICDEAHLLPDIVSNISMFTLTQSLAIRTTNMWRLMEKILPHDSDIYSNVMDNYELTEVFRQPFRSASLILKYFDFVEDYYRRKILPFKSKYVKVTKDEDGVEKTITQFDEPTLKILNSIVEDYEVLVNYHKVIITELINERPEDLYFTSEKLFNENTYKHIIRDLSEAQLVRNNFISKCKKIVFMSATLGNPNEFAHLCGLKDGEFDSFVLPSTFDFTNSPIYRCKSGLLTSKSFDSSIDKVIMDIIKICDQYHPKEKGIIHTATFKITDLLKQKVNLISTDPKRYLFYQTSDEKEKQIQKLKDSNYPYIIIGPSLQEGIDLKDDEGRFNILVKVPYSMLSEYIKKKIARYPFWYQRDTIQKIVQSIGRTNRHKNDYSTTYLLDTKFEDLIYLLDTDQNNENNMVFIPRLKIKSIT